MARARSFDGDDDMPLLWYLRDELRLTGTRFGCGAGLCGACTVHVDGQAVRACQTQMRAVQNKRVTTIEGLSPDGTHPVQRAWEQHNVAQCGYCQPGQIMQAAATAAADAEPDRRGHRSRHGRQHLPLRHLPAHPRGHQEPRRTEAGHEPRRKRQPPPVPARRRHCRRLRACRAESCPRRLLAQQPAFRTEAESAPLNPSVYLGIRPDGTVFIVTHRSEMGTGIRTIAAAGGRRRARRRLEPRDHRAGHRRYALRRSEHRRLAVDPRLLRGVPPRRRRGAGDAA